MVPVPMKTGDLCQVPELSSGLWNRMSRVQIPSPTPLFGNLIYLIPRATEQCCSSDFTPLAAGHAASSAPLVGLLQQDSPPVPSRASRSSAPRQSPCGPPPLTPSSRHHSLAQPLAPYSFSAESAASLESLTTIPTDFSDPGSGRSTSRSAILKPEHPRTCSGSPPPPSGQGFTACANTPPSSTGFTGCGKMCSAPGVGALAPT